MSVSGPWYPVGTSATPRKTEAIILQSVLLTLIFWLTETTRSDLVTLRVSLQLEHPKIATVSNNLPEEYMSVEYPELRGIVTVLNTPFTQDDHVDLKALQRHAELAIGAGVAGFLIPANAGEVQSLSAFERQDMVIAVLDVARGRAVVVGGASAPSLTERCRTAESLAELGSDVILVSQPYENKGQYLSELKEFAAVTKLPLMVQDWDANGSGVPLPVLVEAFSRIPEFQYLKVETLDAGPKYTALKKATNNRMHVSGGWTVMQLIEALDRGVDAFMPTSLHRIYVRIYDLYRAGNRNGAIELFRRALPILAFSNQHLEHSIHFFKRLLWRQGIYPTPGLRTPKHVFDEHHQRVADEFIELALEIDKELAPGTGNRRIESESTNQ